MLFGYSLARLAVGALALGAWILLGAVLVRSVANLEAYQNAHHGAYLSNAYAGASGGITLSGSSYFSGSAAPQNVTLSGANAFEHNT